MQKLLGISRRAIIDYNMIKTGDKIAVGVSGGKDSVALLAMLTNYRKFATEKFDLLAINIDLGFEGTSQQEVDALKDYCKSINVEFIIHKTSIANVIFNERKEKSPCSLCSKMRRGALNTIAIENGCNKLALGHHADDILETMLMSLFYEGRFSTFAPVSYMDRTGMTLIRPFIYAEEKCISSTAKRLGLPIVFNPCPKDKHSVRTDMKEFISEQDYKKRGTKQIMLGAIFNPERNNLWDKSLPSGYEKRK